MGKIYLSDYYKCKDIFKQILKMDKRKIRDIVKFVLSCIFSWLYIPHIVLYYYNSRLKRIIDADLERRKGKIAFCLRHGWMFLYYIHTDSYFRTLFYHRVGPIVSSLIGWWRPGDKYFVISKTTKIGEGAYFIHPFASEINAKSIGKNFSCRHLTTLGNKADGKNDKRPVIGDNVTLGVNVTIIGDITIGNNVIIGAGSVVVKDIPDNCIAVGNPCREIKKIE